MIVFRKIWRSIFSWNNRLRFALLPYYRQIATDSYLGIPKADMMALFVKTNVNYFRKKTPLEMLHRALNTSLYVWNYTTFTVNNA